MVLRQALPQYLEAAAAVAGACDDDLAVNRNAPFVLDGRNESRRVGIVRMGRDGKAEFRRTDRPQLVPSHTVILPTEDAVVVLAPDDLGIVAQRARRWTSWAIGCSRCSGGMYSAYMPRLILRHEIPPSVARPHAPGRNADADVVGTAPVD